MLDVKVILPSGKYSFIANFQCVCSLTKLKIGIERYRGQLNLKVLCKILR